MASSPLNYQQIAWLNGQLASSCRRWRRIRERLKARGFTTADSTYLVVDKLVCELINACETTHHILARDRHDRGLDKIPGSTPTKPSAHSLQRYERWQKEMAERERGERGL